MAEVEVNCNGCYACCDWAGDATLSPVLTKMESGSYETMMVEDEIRLKMSSKGKCIYLHRGKCSIWRNRPLFCREFDCRTIWDEVKKTDAVLVRMCVAAELLERGIAPGPGFSDVPIIVVK